MHGKVNRCAIPFLFSLAALVGSGAVIAETERNPEQAFFEELPVVLSVSRLPQSLHDTPGAVTVIDRDTIRATGYRTLPDLLRLVPGFNVSWLRGWWGVVNYHGLSGEFSNRILVLIDGRPINSDYFQGGIDWMSQPLALDDIDRIEVLRGSNSAAYGTNAFLGVVNILTQHASQSRGVFASFREGDKGVSDRTLRLGAGLENLDVRLTLNQTRDHGLDNLPDNNRLNFATLRADWRPTYADELTLSLGQQRGVGGEGFTTDTLNPPRDRVTRNEYQQLKWRHALSSDNELSVQYYHNRDRYTDEIVFPTSPVPQFPIPPVFLPLVFDQNRDFRRDSLELQHYFRLLPTLRMVWGAETRRESIESRVFFGPGPNPHRDTQRLFANLEWRALPKLLINAGAMAEKVSISGTTVSPRLFANYEIAPEHVLRAGVSTATRAPTLYEAFADLRTARNGFPLDQITVGNPNLKQERIIAREIGYVGQIPAWHLQADVRAYHESLQNLIAQVPLPAAQLPVPTLKGFTYENVETARLSGVSYQIKFSPFNASQLVLGQAFERIAQSSKRLSDSAPTHSTSVMWTQKIADAWSFTLIHYAIGAMEWLEFGDRINAHRRTDARIGYAFSGAGVKGEISISALNLFDRYNEFRNGVLPNDQVFTSRTFATLRLEF